VTVRIGAQPWRFNVCALALVPIVVLAAATRTDAQTKAYVTHSGANLVTVIDTKTGTVTGTIPVGANPSAVVVSQDGRHAYVANGGSSSISIIDTACDPTASECSPVTGEIPVGAGPSSLAVTPDDKLLYVMTAAGVVEVVGTDGTTGTSIPIGAVGDLAISPDGTRVYVAAGLVYVINTQTNSVSKQIAPELESIPGVTNNASSVAFSPDGKRAYIGVYTFISAHAGFSATGNLLIVDTTSETATGTIDLFTLPGAIAFTPDGSRAYVGINYIWIDTGYGAGFVPGRYAAVIDALTDGIAGIIDFGADGAAFMFQNFAAGIGVTPDRSAVYSAIPRIGVVDIADINTNTVGSSPAVSPVPGALAIVPDATAALRPYVIDAADDSGSVSTFGGTAVSSVLDNDLLGNIRVGTKHVTLTQVSAADGLALDPQTGAVTVATDTAAGAYALSYRICETTAPSNCDEAAVAVTVRPKAVIDAVNDSVSTLPGWTALASVLANDTLDGAAATASQVTLSQVSSTSDGIKLDVSNGSVSVAEGTLPGPQTLTYMICEAAAPANCDAADVAITVNPFPITAGNDSGSALRTGGTAVANVLGNDTFANGSAFVPRVRLTQLDSTDAGVALNPATGAVTVAGGTPVGAHTLHYSVCEAATPSNCAQATVSVAVQHLPIFAASYSVRASSKNASTALASVLANDRLNGAPATTANVILSLVSVSPANNMITLDLTDGSVDILGKSRNSVPHTLTYQICESAMPSNCAQGTVKIDLSGGGGR